MIGPADFIFLNVRGSVDELGWDSPKCEKLWRYNLHYFDDLNAAGSEGRQSWHLDIVMRWLAENPPGAGTAWEPYPTSLRIVNWIKWARSGQAFPQSALNSLAVQTRWLARRLEWHLLGNHLFANAKALLFAGLFFAGDEGDLWLEKGLSILIPQIREQFLDDGAQFELSPMYHALAMEDVLDLINAMLSASDTAGQRVRDALAALTGLVPGLWRWLMAMTHPDGGIALFNDAAFGIAPDLSELAAYARRLGFEQPEGADSRATWFEQSGYARLTSCDAVLIADMGRIGPDYLPGHAHADTLGFEMSLGGKRLFVDSGTSVYGTGAERLRQRGTAAHNTVTVAGMNSSDIWGGFRVGRRAYPISPSLRDAGTEVFAEAGHDGYAFLAGGIMHRRKWCLRDDSLTVTDALVGNALAAEVRFHLHPDVTADTVDAERGVLGLADGRKVLWYAPGLAVSVEPSTWHPEFGISWPSRCLVANLCSGRSHFEFNWN